MGVVLFKCPVTEQEFSTGIHIAKDEFTKLPDTVTKLPCPRCGRLHAWWTREARIMEPEIAPAALART
jgi:hypothetical protein